MTYSKIFIVIFVMILLFVLLKNVFFSNGYIGINMKPCIYCKLFSGKHFHYLSPDKPIWRDNIKSSKHMCDICKQNPGQYHFHQHLRSFI